MVPKCLRGLKRDFVVPTRVLPRLGHAPSKCHRLLPSGPFFAIHKKNFTDKSCPPLRDTASRVDNEMSEEFLVEQLKKQWIDGEDDPELLELMADVFQEHDRGMQHSTGDDVQGGKPSEIEDEGRKGGALDAILSEESLLQSLNDHRYSMGLFAPGRESNPSKIDLFSLKLHELANCYASRGLNFEKTRNLFEQAIDLNPYLGSALYDLGCFLFSNDLHVEAATYFERVKKMYPSYVPAYIDLATIFITRGEHERALEILRQADSIDSENSVVKFNMAICLQNAGNVHDAADCFARAYELDKSIDRAFFGQIGCLSQLGQWHSTIPLLERFIRENPTNSNALIILGYSYSHCHQLDKAIATFRGVIQLYPESLEAHINLGMALLEAGNFTESVESLKFALGMAPDNAQLHLGLGHALRMCNDVDGAIQHYEAAINLDDSITEAHSSLGILYQTSGLEERAKPFLERALQLEPNNADVLHIYGKVLEKLNGDEKQSEQYYQRAYEIYIQQLPKLVRKSLECTSVDQIHDQIRNLIQDPMFEEEQLLQLYCNVATMMRSVKMNSEAVRIYRALCKIRPDYYPCLLNLAQLFALNGNYEEALPIYERLILLAPNEADPFVGLAEIHIKNGRLDDAIDVLKRTTTKSPIEVKPWNLLADCYFDLEMYDEARVAYQNVSKLAPNDPNPLLSIGVCLFNLGRYHDSIMTYESAILLDPNYHLPYYNIALAKKHIGKNAEAIDDLKNSIKLNPHFPDAKLELGILLLSKNDKNHGIPLVQEAIAIDPNLHNEIPYDVQKLLLLPKSN